MTQTITTTQNEASPQVLRIPPSKPRNHFEDAHPSFPSSSDIYTSSPEELVDKALHALQEAGVQLIEWKSLLYRRMGVPVIIKDHHYLVPDADLPRASTLLETVAGLPLSLPPPLLLQTGGDFYAQAHMHRISHATSLALAQHLVLYPLSLAALSPAALSPQPRLTALLDPCCRTVLVPAPPAVYASLLKMMRRYSRYAPTRIVLESDLSELIGYHLYGLADGYVDGDDEAACAALEVDRRVEDAVNIVRGWRAEEALCDDDNGEEGDGEARWIADALEGVVGGTSALEDVPCARKVACVSRL
ncbi:hypothetical protein BC628DRAFT_1320151 [Trametes gibbosa]|nr:hypothetical protein BC628DRAFT_1320151 [Trametes gibbosa]